VMKVDAYLRVIFNKKNFIMAYTVWHSVWKWLEERRELPLYASHLHEWRKTALLTVNKQ